MTTPSHSTASRIGDLPAVAMVALATVLSFASVAGWLGWAALRNRASALALLTLAVATGLVLVLRLRPRTERLSGLASLFLGLPALGVLAPALVGLLRGAPAGLEWFLNGDHPRHAVYVVDTWAQGTLSYGVESYPRGWHSALAALWSVVGAGPDGADAIRLLVLMAAASLALSATLALATGELGYALAIRAGLSQKAAVAAGLMAGASTLLNFSLANYQALGYENSLVAAVALAVASREALVRPGSTVSLVVSSAATVVVAHAWQLLLPPVAMAAIWCGFCAVQRPEYGPRRTMAVLVPVTLALSASAVVAVVTEVGLGHATAAGPDSPVPISLLGAGLLSTGILVLRQREGAITSLAAVAIAPSVVAVGLAVGLGLNLSHYYPSKLLWHSTVLGLPWVVVGALVLLDAAQRRLPLAGRAARRLVGLMACVVVVFALALPWGSQLGTWSSVDGRRVLGAVIAPGASGAVVVWLEDSPTTDSVARILLDVFRAEHTRARAPQARLSVQEECAQLRAAARPTVLTTAPEAEVRLRYGCVAEIVVLPATPLP